MRCSLSITSSAWSIFRAIENLSLFRAGAGRHPLRNTSANSASTSTKSSRRWARTASVNGSIAMSTSMSRLRDGRGCSSSASRRLSPSRRLESRLPPAKPSGNFSCESASVEVATPAATKTQPPKAHTRDNPSCPTGREAPLTHEVSSKLTLHLTFSIGLRLTYEAGDACGVIPQNDPAWSKRFCTRSNSAAGQVAVAKAGTVPLHEALRHHLVRSPGSPAR